MTDQELKDIVSAVVAELEKSGVDFDYKAEQAKDDDLVFVIRGTAPNYQGVTVTWKGLLDIITAQATQAKTDAVNAKDIAQQILTQVQSKGTEITNFVATSKAELETQKNESVNAVKSVYQTDLNELKGDLADLQKPFVAYSNAQYLFENNKFHFKEAAGFFSYAFINRSCATFTSKNLSSVNDQWVIFAEYENGVCIVNLKTSSGYYLSYDLTVMSRFNILNAVTLENNSVRIECSNDSVSIIGNNKTVRYTTSNKPYSDDIFKKYRLGYAVNNQSYSAICEIIPDIGTMYDDIQKNTSDIANLKREVWDYKWNNKTGDFLGDSLIADTQFLPKMTELYGIVANNYGRSGTTISNIASNNFSTRINEMSDDCDFIFVMGGTNDWGLGCPLGNKGDTELNTFYGGLYDVFSKLREKFPTKPIFVSTITQRDWTSTTSQSSGIDSNSNGNSIMDFNEAIIYMAHRYGCIVIDGFGESGITVDNITSYTYDRLHFNSDGATRFATFVKDRMEIITPY